VGTEILPGVRVLLGGVKYFVGSFKNNYKKLMSRSPTVCEKHWFLIFLRFLTIFDKKKTWV
jgi:hypothetical protein